MRLIVLIMSYCKHNKRQHPHVQTVGCWGLNNNESSIKHNNSYILPTHWIAIGSDPVPAARLHRSSTLAINHKEPFWMRLSFLIRSHLATVAYIYKVGVQRTRAHLFWTGNTSQPTARWCAGADPFREIGLLGRFYMLCEIGPLGQLPHDSLKFCSAPPVSSVRFFFFSIVPPSLSFFKFIVLAFWQIKHMYLCSNI